MNRQRIFEIMDIASSDDIASKTFDVLFLLLILLNVMALILETVNPLHVEYEQYFDYFELFSISIFSIEFLLRIYTSPFNPRCSNSRVPYLSLFKSPLFIIDLLSIAPFYLQFLGIDLRFLRIVRLGKIFRYSKSLQMFIKVFKDRSDDLLLCFIILILLTIVTATGIYYSERIAQPQHFSSIPESIWWSIVTLTTIGYGDVFPITIVGKLFTGFIAVIGIGMIALPTGIIGAGFLDAIQEERKNR